MYACWIRHSSRACADRPLARLFSVLCHYHPSDLTHGGHCTICLPFLLEAQIFWSHERSLCLPFLLMLVWLVTLAADECRNSPQWQTRLNLEDDGNSFCKTCVTVMLPDIINYFWVVLDIVDAMLTQNAEAQIHCRYVCFQNYVKNNIIPPSSHYACKSDRQFVDVFLTRVHHVLKSCR